MESLDLTSLKNAVASLKEVIDLYQQSKTDAILRDSLIQRFEYTYSLCLKMIKRYFKISAFAPNDIELMTFNAMIRQANKMSLLKSDLTLWDLFRQKRNMTSHTYDENVAKSVAETAIDFYDEALFLLGRLSENLS